MTQDNCAACFYYLLCHLFFLNCWYCRHNSLLHSVNILNMTLCFSSSVINSGQFNLTFMYCRYCHPLNIYSLFKFTKYFCSWELSSVNVIFFLQIFIWVFLVTYEWFFQCEWLIKFYLWDNVGDFLIWWRRKSGLKLYLTIPV